MKKLFLTLTTLIVFHGCTSTPAVETRHKVIPSKKNEHVSSVEKNPRTQPAPSVFTQPQAPIQAPQQPVAPPPPVVVTTPPVVVQETKFFNFSNERKDKPRSDVDYNYDSQTIGVILPITGKNASLGQRVLNAIRLGLGLEDKNPSFQLAIYDSQSNSDTAALGVEKLLRDDKAVAILGGLSSKEAQNISAKAEFFAVPFFSFSQKSGLTDDSDYTFRNSVTPEMQVARLLQHAFKNLNAKRFAILYPNDAYGIEFANKYWDLVLAGGGEVVAAQTYDPKDTDLNIYIKKLVGTQFIDARIDEYRARQKEIAEKKRKQKEAEPNKKRNTREHEAQENVLQPVVDFDVLFVPDSGKALGQIMAFMKNNDVTQMTYLGTNLWNTPDLVRRVGSGTNNVFFVDASFTPEEQKKSEFHGKYVAKYGEEPTIVEAQVYEAAKILKDVIGNSSMSRTSLASQLSTLGRKQGAYTEVRMNNNHEIERPLHIFGLFDGLIQKTE